MRVCFVVMYELLLYGCVWCVCVLLCAMCCVKVFVWLVCDLLRDGAWFALWCVFVFVSMIACCVCE